MTLTIEIYREYDQQRPISRLRACVVQEMEMRDGKTREVRGADLLVRRITRVDSAMNRAKAAILEEYKLIDSPAIRFRVSDDAAPAAKPHKKKTPPAAVLPIVLADGSLEEVFSSIG